jgi:hypothetical protein
VTAADVVTELILEGGAIFTGDLSDDRVVIRSRLLGEGSSIRLVSGGVVSSRLTVSERTLRTLGFTQDQDVVEGDSFAQTVVTRLNQDAPFHAVATATLDRLTPVNGLGGVVSLSLQEITVSFLGATSDPSADWDLTQMKLVINGGANAGTYGIVSTTWSAPDLTFEVDRNLRDSSPGNRHSITVKSERIKITSKDTSTSAYIDVNESATNSADAVLGLPTVRTYGTVEKLLVEENDAISGWVPADISRLRIRVGDMVVEEMDVAAITSIDEAPSGILGVTPIVPTTSLTSGFTIESSASREYELFEDALQDWRDALSPYETLEALDVLLAPLLLLDQPSPGQVNAAYNYVDAYKTKLTELDAELRDYVLTLLPVIKEVSQTMAEHGQDRARELLLQARISEFFNVTARTASYSRMLMDAGSNVAVEDLNEPTKTRDEGETEFDRYVAGWIEDENTALVLEDEEEIPDSPIEDYWPDG